ncbi:MAG: Mg/Co transporter [Parcubacteria group bacterium Gr01-1014_91]|nr:MAG: Mg/Co transporter [Parcubacteria group bacterium Gr01-1014_91]
MIFRHEYLNGVWIDLEQPTENEVRQIAQEFSVNERIEKELLSPTPVPMVAGDEGMSLLVLHFPTQGSQDGETKSQEVDFIVGKNFIITVRYEVVASIHHLKKLLETQQLVAKKTSVTTDTMLEVLFAHLYTSVRDHVNQVADNLSRVEKDMFDGRERMTVRSISNISREFLHIEALLTGQEESIVRFLDALRRYEFFGPAFSERVVRILAERTYTARVVGTFRAVATELRETNVALLGARQNEIMKTLTTVNFIFLPLGLISWIFTMRTEGMPLIDSPNAFLIVLGIMLVVAALLITFFIKRRWLF